MRVDTSITRNNKTHIYLARQHLLTKARYESRFIDLLEHENAWLTTWYKWHMVI